MLLESSMMLLPVLAVGIVVGGTIRSLYNAYFSTLAKIPGPLAARLTDLWYVYRQSQGHFEKDNIKLHEEYGKTV